MSKSFLNNHAVRGLRNNNPGNLIRTPDAWQGKIPFPQSKDEKFEQFTALKWGLRAMLKDLIHDINKGKNTVTKLINEYAPKSENNTAAYILSVCKTIGVKPDEKISAINNEFLILLVRAILKVELGGAHTQVKDSDIQEALELLGDVSTTSLKVTIKKNWKPLIPALAFLVVFF
ncbi:hypothetical protein [Flavobacterium sp. ov086]|uniref:hypothetical protein n=1 Tax=Flavobacterium sp. ov086 TaxID=1761785 RepID=UPI000B665B6C|nr:hypothetical protein [Flavobacterium sp. ov086]SNS02590.1 hypothetical protein SAMN04487979_14518 [Flavobacterium sp. ov086]